MANRFIFLGKPGAGKGSIAKIFAKKEGYIHISTGDLFRAHISNETPIGLEVKAILDKGDLVPDEITTRMVNHCLSAPELKDKHVILDGFPRTLAQATALDQFCDVTAAIMFDLEDEEVIKRLSGRRVAKESGAIYHVLFNPPKVEGICDISGEALIQRDDDKEDAIRHRLDVYEELTRPLVSYYELKDKLVVVPATGSIDTVFETAKQLMDAYK